VWSGHGGLLPFVEWVIAKVSVLVQVVAALGCQVHRGRKELAVISFHMSVSY
jgi:fumarate reductase subunit D